MLPTKYTYKQILHGILNKYHSIARYIINRILLSQANVALVQNLNTTDYKVINNYIFQILQLFFFFEEILQLKD